MKTKEEIRKYNRIRGRVVTRLRKEHYALYRQIYMEEAIKEGVNPHDLSHRIKS
jgi:hypothetical protein